jgi:hypothetical protein
MAVDQEPSPIIVYGAPRSGTTYLTRILNEHPEIFISHETRLFVWVHESLNVLTQRDQVLLSYRERFVEHLYALYPELVRNFYSSLYPQARYWGDKNPHYASLPNKGCLNTISTLFPGTRFIHIIRDGRDVASSLIRKGWVSFDLAHELWIHHVDIGRSFGKSQPQNQYYELRYEELIRDDLGSAQKLFDFLGIGLHSNVVEFCQNQQEERTPLSEPTRNINSGVAISDWNKTMTLSQRARSLELLGDHLIRYGYEKDSTIATALCELNEQRRMTPVQRIREAVRATVPPDATVILVSMGHDQLLDLGGRQMRRFSLIRGDREPERLVGEGAEGSVEAPWIEADKVYEFRLYAATEHRRLLAATTVIRGEKPPAQTADRTPARLGLGTTLTWSMITASPNPVSAGEGPGKTTISWNTGDGSKGLVYLSTDGGSERLFGEGEEGSMEAPWIEADKVYEFRLCRGTQRTRLATVTVTRSEEPFLVAAPNPVSAGEGPGKTTISWNTGDGSEALVYMSEIHMDAVYVPADSTAGAIAQVKELRANGGDFLLFPSGTFWWLEHSGELQQHLNTNYHRIRSDENCIIYRLRPLEHESTEA